MERVGGAAPRGMCRTRIPIVTAEVATHRAVRMARRADKHPTVELPDPDDQHVVAAAMEAGASMIVTWNLRDFPVRELRKHDLARQTPDAFLVGLYEQAPDMLIALLANARRIAPPEDQNIRQRLIASTPCRTLYYLTRSQSLVVFVSKFIFPTAYVPQQFRDCRISLPILDVEPSRNDGGGDRAHTGNAHQPTRYFVFASTSRESSLSRSAIPPFRPTSMLASIGTRQGSCGKRSWPFLLQSVGKNRHNRRSLGRDPRYSVRCPWFASTKLAVAPKNG